MIFGGSDGALEKPLAELTGRSFDNYTLRYIDGASHWVQQDEPEQFNTLVRQFLA
jgi:epoxide hydrolase 4